jgi:FkbM family methyltransferase
VTTFDGGNAEHSLESCAGVREVGLAALQWYVRHFPISKGKGRLVSLLWKPLSWGASRRQTVLRQADVRVVCDLTKFIQRRLYFWGGYEEESCAHWIRLARESRIIFDIGANVGLYSLLAAWANPQSEIHAFEPTPAMVDILTSNIELNRMQNISVVPKAVGPGVGTGFLRMCAGSNGSNEGMNYLAAAREDGSDLPVEVISLDGYCQQHGIERIDLMKMDIEGGEYAALLGAERLLQKQAIGCLFIELTEWAAKRSGYATQAIRQLLMDTGYHLFRVRSGSLQPVAMKPVTLAENVIALASKSRPPRVEEEDQAREAGPWQLP